MRKSSHVQYDLQYHLVWTTKYRYKVLEGKIAERVRQIVLQVCRTKNVTILKGKVGKNHVHILASIPPSISISQFMQYVKGRSSRQIQEEFPNLKKRYWGQHLWSTGYFARSVGTVTQEIVEEYIENQIDDDDANFKVQK